MTCEDKNFVARQQIFTEVSSPANELQARNWRLCYETKLVELWREVGRDTKFLKVAGFACHKASVTAVVTGKYIKNTLCISE